MVSMICAILNTIDHDAKLFKLLAAQQNMISSLKIIYGTSAIHETAYFEV